MIDFKRAPGETDYQYKWRIYQAKNSGLLDDMGWPEIAEKIDAELRPDEPQYSESVYRKEAAIVQRWNDNMFSTQENQSGESSDGELKVLLREIQKEKVKLRDERTEYNRAIRQEARFEERIDLLEQVLASAGEEKFPQSEIRPYISDRNDGDSCDLVIMLSDWHIGACFDSSFGQYNVNIARERLSKLLDEIMSVQEIYHANNAYVMLLGDMCSGNIHNSIRITNSENFIQQVKTASDLVSGVIFELSKSFENVYVNSVCGNHTRLDKKDDALKDERIDDLIPFIVGKSLKHLNNIHMVESEENTIAEHQVRGKSFVSVHGDYDQITESGIAKLALMLGHTPYCVCMGHLHTSAYEEVCGVKVVRGGCLPGSGDDYTIQKRLTGKPSQTVLVCGERGIKAMIPIELAD